MATSEYISSYFNDSNYFIQQYGEKTVFLKQCGKFWEIYGKVKPDGSIEGSPLSSIAKIADLKIGWRHPPTIKMIGIPVLSSSDKFLEKILSSGYSIAMMAQIGSGTKVPHISKLDCPVLTPGTGYVEESKQLSRYTSCIWIEKFKPLICNGGREKFVCGMAAIDTFTAKVVYGEFENEYRCESICFDDLERFISIYNPSEIIFVHNISESELSNIIRFCGINPRKKIIRTFHEALFKNGIQNVQKQTYQENILSLNYPDKDIDTFFINFQERPTGTSCLCYLLDYLKSADTAYVNKLKEPITLDSPNFLITANHSLEQLNIIDNGIHQGKNSSILRLLDQCATPMGSRLLKNKLLSPSTNISDLNETYDRTEFILNNYNALEKVFLPLKECIDMDKICRRVVLGSIKSFSLFELLNNIKKIDILKQKLISNSKISFYNKQKLKNLSYSLNLTICSLDKFLLEKQEIQNEEDINVNSLQRENFTFIKKNNDLLLDEYVDHFISGEIVIENIRNKLCEILCKEEYSNSYKKDSFIKKIRQEKMGLHLQLTGLRKSKLEKLIKKENEKIFQFNYKNQNGEVKEFNLDLERIAFSSVTSGKFNIVGDQIYSLLQNINSSRENLKSREEIVFREFIKSITNSPTLENILFISDFVADFDLSFSRAQIAKQNCYCKPIIKEFKSSFIDCSELRHPLIEKLNQKESFVTNDIQLGENKNINGLMIYGTNAVGKSTLMRAVGISIIMAQSGFYVPCSRFEFSPYKKIFTRIVGNDNLFKGLSSFAVEMTGFRTILKEADKHSLVLGDELCNGTETSSASAIMIQGVKTLHERNCSFLFATHLHHISHHPIILSLQKEKLKLMHMKVKYDPSSGELIYDRKLCNSAGPSTYGLEVCKALDLPQDFLDGALSLRDSMSSDSSSQLNCKISRYNSKVLVGKCEECGRNGEETHHMIPQYLANDNGYTQDGYIHHGSNLQILCKDCHLKKTKEKIVEKRKKTSKGFKKLKIIVPSQNSISSTTSI